MVIREGLSEEVMFEVWKGERAALKIQGSPLEFQRSPCLSSSRISEPRKCLTCSRHPLYVCWRDKRDRRQCHHTPYLMGEATLQHAVPGDFTQVTRAQLPHLSGNCIFFHKCFLDPPPQKANIWDGRISISILHIFPKLETSDRHCRSNFSLMSATWKTKQHSHPLKLWTCKIIFGEFSGFQRDMSKNPSTLICWPAHVWSPVKSCGCQPLFHCDNHPGRVHV